jgi:hypothetical protein
MLETGSYWILQEVFVDPTVAGTPLECSAQLQVTSELVERENNRCKVTVEISGSLLSQKQQVANVRFVNFATYELKKKITNKTLLKKVEKRKVEELITLLPLYLIKAGISLNRVSYEL